MAPKKRTTRCTNKNSVKSKKVDAFLKDFDQEVKTRVDRIRAEGEILLKEISTLYNMEVLRLPTALRDMNWLTYHALGGSEKALEQAASVDLDILEITKAASEAVQTPLKTLRKAKKVKKAVETIEEGEEEMDAPRLPAGKRFRQEGGISGAAEPVPVAAHPRHKLEKAKSGTKKAPAPKRSRPPSARPIRLSKRLMSKASFDTLASQGAQPAPTGTAFATKFDSSVFKTPGLRAPAAHERVFSISANGSPLADSNDIFITVPLSGGESLRLRASELSKHNLLHLSQDALGSVKKLSAQLVTLCGSLKSQK
ncbi:borealin-like [Hemicordylus capensis]|uniref:borealin-like n=1 Tax=Hemicordylus capensis TaxID=884348 RepID=UPI0023049BC5|nr:borealin-like [Hemicordylus capensis]